MIVCFSKVSRLLNADAPHTSDSHSESHSVLTCIQARYKPSHVDLKKDLKAK